MESTRIKCEPSFTNLSASSPSQKIATLMKALDEALSEDSLDQTTTLIGEEALNRCLDLRTSLTPIRSSLDLLPPKSEPSRDQKSLDFFSPGAISAFSITPWKSSTIPTDLPALPAVLDTTLETSAFTHVGCGAGRLNDLNYERLEWVGDVYLEMISTLLISQTFPSLGPGKASQLRERLVKNVTLANYSRQYGFDRRARLPDSIVNQRTNPNIPPEKQEMTKILGDIFEAYVAAVVLSDPADGVRRVSEWLKDLWGMTLAKEIIGEEMNGFKFDSPLWRLRGCDPPITSNSTGAIVPLNPKEQLQKLIGTKGVKLSYKDFGLETKDPVTKLALFSMAVYLDGLGEKGKLLGTGKGLGKKEAGARAAEVAMQNKKLMKGLVAKKTLVDAQLAQEKEALEAQGGG